MNHAGCSERERVLCPGRTPRPARRSAPSLPAALPSSHLPPVPLAWAAPLPFPLHLLGERVPSQALPSLGLPSPLPDLGAVNTAGHAR